MNLIRMFHYIKMKEALYSVIAILFIVVQVWLDLKLPDYMAEITRLVQTEGNSLSEVLTAGVMMLLCALGSLLASVIVGYCMARIAAGLSMNLRSVLYEKVMGFSMEELGCFSTASLITRSTNDINQIMMVTAIGMQILVRAPIMAVWAILKISNKNWQWTMVTLGAVSFVLIMLLVVFALVVPRFKKIQTLTDSMNRVTRENLSGIRIVRAYNAEEYQENKFRETNEELTSNNLFAQKALAVMQPGMTLVLSGVTLAIYWVGAFMIHAADRMDRIGLFSDMVVFSAYAIQIIMAFMMLTITMIILPRASVSAKRISEVLMTEIRMKNGTKDQGDETKRGRVEFRNVSFRYPGTAEDMLQDITFTANSGETVAIIGATGSGKSTLINLVPRFFDVSAGEILVDGVNVKEYNTNALRKKIGYVSQKAILFSGSVRDNIAYGDSEDAGGDAVSEAIKTAQAEEFVSGMEGTVDAVLSQGGTNISGGQKQRLSIARAIYRDPEIYLFDDSFSALDYKTDKMLRDALKKKTREKGATVIIVAQRIGTIMDADRIIVLEDGAVTAQGTHRELLASSSVYKEIAESQLSKEELYGDVENN